MRINQVIRLQDDINFSETSGTCQDTNKTSFLYEELITIPIKFKTIWRMFLEANLTQKHHLKYKFIQVTLIY